MELMLTTWRRYFKMIQTSFFFMSLMLPRFAVGESYFYVVKKSDIASSILSRSGLKPIYKKNGFLRRLQRINPEIDDLNIIFPGQKITFTEKLVKKGKSLGLIGVSSENEIYFLDPKLKPQPDLNVKKIEMAPSQVAPAPLTTSKAAPPQVVNLKPELKKQVIANQETKKTKVKLNRPLKAISLWDLALLF
jgi:hypothetical protein